ncbi:MAG: hypothetical protein QOJ12_1532, partial [Thermoleophilales bacterium]|nr:hypothetical protein [Thermoleophilales bacterium]
MKRTQLVGVISALLGMATVPAIVGAKPSTIDWARRALHVAARADKMARMPIDSSRIKDGSVQNVDLANKAVDSAKVADGAIGTAGLQDGSVTNPKLADGSVGSSKIAGGAIGDAQLGDGAV